MQWCNLFCKLSIFFSLTTLFFVHSAHTAMELIKEEDHEEEQIKNEEEQPLETNDSTACNGVIYFANLVFFFHSPHCFLFTPRTQLWN